jgi:hypothetical protein
MYIRHKRADDQEWASNTLIRTNGTNLYLTNVSIEGAGLDYDGPIFEQGLRVAYSRIFALGVAHIA